MILAFAIECNTNVLTSLINILRFFKCLKYNL